MWKWKNTQIELKTSHSSLASPYRSRCSWKINNKDREYLWRNLFLPIFTNIALRDHSKNICTVLKMFGCLSSACQSPNPSPVASEQRQHWYLHIFCIYFPFPCWSLNNTHSSLLQSQQKTQIHPFSLKHNSGKYSVGYCFIKNLRLVYFGFTGKKTGFQ